MTVSVLLALSLATSSPAASLVFHSTADGDAEAVRFGDMADLSSLPSEMRAPAAALVIWRPVDGRRSVETTSASVAARARALLPALTPYLPAAAPSKSVLLRLAARAETSDKAPSTTARGDVEAVRSKTAPVVPRLSPVVVSLTVGPVVVQRETTALQNGYAGRPLFVRTAEGEVLRVMVPGDAQ
ncbi:hypothetical protein [Brevundimonas faecalis]|uniref:Uncharacterized protein n=1 Tax=Brevundimonas faecalis TaxID=947378 RepID=A0ABV2R7M3_9CAUL